MKYISPKIEILQTATADIIATSSYHTGIHRFGKSNTDSNNEGVAFTLFDNEIDEFFDL